MKNKLAPAILLLSAVCLFASAGVKATAETTTSNLAQETTTTTTAPTYSTAPDIVISDSPDETLGTITFRSSNSKRIAVGKVTTLYLTIKDMPGSINTIFTSSSTAIATVEKLNNVSVKVTGLREGEVVITATAGGKSAKYTLYVGEEVPETVIGGESGEGGTILPGQEEGSGGTADLDLFTTSEEYQRKLAAYTAASQQAGAGSIIIGVIGLAAIISAFGTVLSVMFSNRSPKLTLYPSTQRQFSIGGYRGKKTKRLLPDRYYRNLRKY